MKLILLFCLSVSLVSRTAFGQHEQTPLGDTTPERFLLELDSEVKRWVTEEEKWALRRVRQADGKGIKP